MHAICVIVDVVLVVWRVSERFQQRGVHIIEDRPETGKLLLLLQSCACRMMFSIPTAAIVILYAETQHLLLLAYSVNILR